MYREFAVSFRNRMFWAILPWYFETVASRPSG